MASIIDNNPAEDLRFHLIWERPDDEELALFHSFFARNGLKINCIEVHDDSIERMYDLGAQGHVTHHAYYRLLIPDLFPSLSTMLYLDVDIVVIDSIDEMLKTDLSGIGAAVVREPDPHKLGSFGVAPGQYFNSGMMLMNLDYWRRHDIGRKALDFAKTHPEAILAWDQCALNVTLLGQVKYLDPKWNCTLSNAKNYNCSNPAIVHYTGQRKPWSEPWRQPYGVYFVNYSRLTPWPLDYFGGERRSRKKFCFLETLWRRTIAGRSGAAAIKRSAEQRSG